MFTLGLFFGHWDQFICPTMHVCSTGKSCLPIMKCKTANIFGNSSFDWRHHKSLVLATLATFYPTNGFVSAPFRQSASHPVSQPAHLTSWPITMCKTYKNTGMANPGPGRKIIWASVPNTLHCRSQTSVTFSFDSQGKPDRDHSSKSSSSIELRNCGILIASLSPNPENIWLCDHY